MYNGPTGNHHVVGSITKYKYGIHSNGHQFKVFKIDQEARPTVFVLME